MGRRASNWNRGYLGSEDEEGGHMGRKRLEAGVL